MQKSNDNKYFQPSTQSKKSKKKVGIRSAQWFNLGNGHKHRGTLKASYEVHARVNGDADRTGRAVQGARPVGFTRSCDQSADFARKYWDCRSDDHILLRMPRFFFEISLHIYKQQ